MFIMGSNDECGSQETHRSSHVEDVALSDHVLSWSAKWSNQKSLIWWLDCAFCAAFQQLDVDYFVGEPNKNVANSTLTEVPILRMYGVSEAGVPCSHDQAIAIKLIFYMPKTHHRWNQWESNSPSLSHRLWLKRRFFGKISWILLFALNLLLHFWSRPFRTSDFQHVANDRCTASQIVTVKPLILHL